MPGGSDAGIAPALSELYLRNSNVNDTIIKLTAFVALCGALTACSGGTSPSAAVSTSNPTVTGSSDALTEAEINALSVTSAMPSTGTATYLGTANLEANDNGDVDIVPADLTMTADFGAQTMSATIDLDGAAHGFSAVGTLTGTGAITGSTFTVPTRGDVQITNLSTNAASTQQMAADMAGSFRGDGAEAVSGTMTDPLDNNVDMGTFYGNKQ